MADVRLSPPGPELRQLAGGSPAPSPNMLAGNLGLSPIRNVPAEATQESQPELGQVPSTPVRDWRPPLQAFNESPTLKFSDRRTPASARLYVASPNGEERNLWGAINLSDSLHTPRLDRGYLDTGGGPTMVTITVPHNLGPDRMHRFEYRGMSYDLQMPDYAQPGTELQVELLPFPPRSPIRSMENSNRPEDTWRMLPPFTQPPYDRWIAETQRLREIEAKKDNELRLELKRKLQILEERYQAERGHRTRQDEIRNLELEVCQAELKICEQQQDIDRVSELNESLRRLQKTHDSLVSEQNESLRQLQEIQDGARSTSVGGATRATSNSARNQPERTSPDSVGDSVPEATVPPPTNPDTNGDAAPVTVSLQPPLSLASAPASPDLVVKRELKEAASVHDGIPSLSQLATSSVSLPVKVGPGDMQNGLALPRQNGISVTLPVKEVLLAAVQPSLSAVPPVMSTVPQPGPGLPPPAPLLSNIPPAVSKTPRLPMQPTQPLGYPLPQRMKSNTSSPRLVTRDTLPVTTTAMRIVRQIEGFSSAASRVPSRGAPGEVAPAPTVQPSPQLTTRSIHVPPSTRPASQGFQVGRASGSTSTHQLPPGSGAPTTTVISPRYRPVMPQGAAASGTSAAAQVGGGAVTRGLSPKYGQRRLEDTHAAAPHPPRRSLQVTRPAANARDMSQQGRTPSPSFRQQSYRATMPGLRQVVVQDAIGRGISNKKRPS